MASLWAPLCGIAMSGDLRGTEISNVSFWDGNRFESSTVREPGNVESPNLLIRCELHVMVQSEIPIHSIRFLRLQLWNKVGTP